MKIQECSTPAVCAGAFPTTATIQTIEPPHNVHHLQGSNGRTDPLKDTRLAWLAENLRRKDVSPLARCVLGWLITAAQWREDRLIIIGKGEIAERMGIGKRTADRCILELLASGCLKLVSRGGSLRGQKRDANTYALGTAFEGTPPVLRPKFKGTSSRPVSPVALVPQVRPVSSVTADQCQELHPLPIVPPNTHTHIKELSLANGKGTQKAFTLDNWMAHTADPALFPGWPAEDRETCFHKAKAKGYETDQTWKTCCGFWFNRWKEYNAKYNAKPTSPAAIVRNAFAPARPAPRSQCESPKAEPTDYSVPWVLENDIRTAIKEGTSLEMIKASCPSKDVFEAALARVTASASTPPMVGQLTKMMVGEFTKHTRPSYDLFTMEARNHGIPEEKTKAIYDQLEKQGWLMKDGSPIKNWKAYLNKTEGNRRRGINSNSCKAPQSL